MSIYSVKGKWRYDFTLSGKRYHKAGFRTKTEAKRAEAQRKEELKNPPPVVEPPIDMAFSALANEYLDFAQRKFAEKTYKYKALVYRKFLAFAGDMPMSKLSIQIIEAYLRTRATNINYNRHRKDLCALFT